MRYEFLSIFRICVAVFVSFVLLHSAVLAQDAVHEPMIVIYKDPPNYPLSAFEQGIEGWVFAQFTVLADGSVKQDSITVLDDEPKGVFTEAALKSAQTLRFKARVSSNGQAVIAEKISYLFRFVFKPGTAENYFSTSYTGRQPPSAK